MRTLVVVPTFQEAANIAELLERVRAAAPGIDVLIVDDNSPDGTATLAKALGDEFGHVDVIVRPEKDGFGSACRTGFSVGVDRGYDVIVQMDADLSHDPATIPTLIAELDAGADLVIGSRYVPGGSIPHWRWYRRTLSRYGNLYARFALRVNTRDLTSGFRAWRTSALRTIEFDSTTATGYLFQIEMARRTYGAGLAVAEVPIVFTDRVRGSSKMSGTVIFEELTHVTMWGMRDRWRRLTRHR